MDQPASTSDDHARWDPAPLEESLGEDASVLTVSVVDRAMRGWWDTMARVVGVPGRRWAHHLPHASGPIVARIEGRPMFDTAAWARFVSLMPGAVALPGRTADMFGVARADVRPPAREPARLLDLWRARRMRHRLRRGECTLDADLARFDAWLDRAVEAALAPGEDGTKCAELPLYALAARLDSMADTSVGWEASALVELANAEAQAWALRGLIASGLPPGAALLELARLTSGGGAALPGHVEALETIARGAATDAPGAIDAWMEVYGWASMSELRLEEPPFRARRDAVERWCERLREVPSARPPMTAPELPAGPPDLVDALRRARSLGARREHIARERARAHAALRACAWTLGERLTSDGVLENVASVFDLSLPELLALARGGAPDPRTLPVAPHAQRPVPAASCAHGSVPVQSVGIPASTGVASGPTVVLEQPDPDTDVDGAVLVCRATDPGWLPLMMRASAIVTERGGPLAHAAIVARELGIPAVVGVAQARELARQHGYATVDGAAGTVDFGT